MSATSCITITTLMETLFTTCFSCRSTSLPTGQAAFPTREEEPPLVKLRSSSLDTIRIENGPVPVDHLQFEMHHRGATSPCDLHGQIDDIFPLLKIPIRRRVAAHHSILGVKPMRGGCQSVHRVHHHGMAVYREGGIPREVVVGGRVVMPLYCLVVLSGSIHGIAHCGVMGPNIPRGHDDAEKHDWNDENHPYNNQGRAKCAL